MKRHSGVLLHISSLPSPYGIGTFGEQAYRFVDFLKKAKQRYWQILPMGPTSYGDSPYQSFSTFAGNAYFIDLDLLSDEGLLLKEEYESISWGESETAVDYATLYQNRYVVLNKAYSRFLKNTPADFEPFCSKEAAWLDDYALFMALKDAHGGRSWHEWSEPLRLREPSALGEARRQYASGVGLWKFIQYEFFTQWNKLKEYANKNGVYFIGDLPIYVADDSSDVWANPNLFSLNKDGVPKRVAGCPPDFFSADGQLWGNPVYDWKENKRTGYDWWIRRLAACFSMYDILRIDHFRGFAGFYSIPYGAKNAKRGRWEKGPGIDLFNAAKKKLRDFPVIAENLGFLTPDVFELLDECGFPGMNILEFAFGAKDKENDHLPHNIKRNCVVYAGTHDNMTIKEWIEDIPKADRAKCLAYMGQTNTDDFVYKFIKLVLSTVADLAVITFQDYLELGKGSRMNVPSTLSGNWQWRCKREDINDPLAAQIAKICKLYDRKFK